MLLANQEELELRFDRQGLIPAVLQDADNLRVLMVGWMNKEAFLRSLETGKACFWSRSRQELWLKGDTSGNIQHIHQILIDCDADTLLVLVKPDGPACHTGQTSCFSRTLHRAGEEPS